MSTTTISEASMNLAKEWNNRKVEISGVGGKVQVETETGEVTTVSVHSRKPSCPNIKSHFIIRASEEFPGTIAFELVMDDDDNDNDNDDGSKKQHRYLTVHMYGDDIRQDAAQALGAVPNLLADTLPLVVDFAIGRPTGETNFEGAGFNYSPMTANASATPTKLQLFTLEVPSGPRRTSNSFGIKSLFGSYWRSQHWDKVVSQSSHLLGDETWYLRSV